MIKPSTVNSLLSLRNQGLEIRTILLPPCRTPPSCQQHLPEKKPLKTRFTPSPLPPSQPQNKTLKRHKTLLSPKTPPLGARDEWVPPLMLLKKWSVSSSAPLGSNSRMASAASTEMPLLQKKRCFMLLWKQGIPE